MAGVIKMTSNANKRRLREQYGLPTSNTSREVLKTFSMSMPEWYEWAANNEREQEIRQFTRRRAASRIQQGTRTLADYRSTGVAVGVTVAIPQEQWNDVDPHANIKPLLRNYVGRKSKVQTIVDGVVTHEIIIDIPKNTDFNRWWDTNWMLWIVDSETTYLSNATNSASIKITPATKIDTQRQGWRGDQAFAEGVTNCILTPMLKWADDCGRNAKSKPSQKRYKTISSKIMKYEDTYTNGIPENELQTISNDLSVDIKIEIPLSDSQFIYCKSHKKPLKVFAYVNTKMHHVELDEVIHKNNYQEVTQNELDAIVNKCESEESFFDYSTSTDGKITKVRTLQGCFVAVSPYFLIVKEFEHNNNIQQYKIDTINDDFADFVIEGTLCNNTIDFVPKWKLRFWGNCENKSWHTRQRESMILNLCNQGRGDEAIKPDIKHIDMIKAYALPHKCEQYVGYMGKITDCRLCDDTVDIEFIKKNPGMYRLSEYNYYGCDQSAKGLLSKFKGIYFINQVYCTPDYIWMHENGIKFRVSQGCWGNRMEFSFGTEKEMENKTGMFAKDEQGVSNYAKWAGSIRSTNRTQTYTMKGDAEFFELIKANSTDRCTIDVFKRSVDMPSDEGNITYPKSHNYVAPHIAAFLMCYQRLTVFNQLKKMDMDKIIRVCVDGIYYVNHQYEMLPNFQTKDCLKFGNECSTSGYISGGGYDRTKDQQIFWDEYYKKKMAKSPPFRQNYKTEAFLGAGGNGKTHYNLSDNGLCRVLYVAPSYKLTRDKELEYKCNTSVLAKCLSDNHNKDIQKYYNTILFDEASMISECDKRQLLKIFYNLKLVFAGDIGFQLPPISGEEMGMDGIENVTTFTENYRFTCPKQLNICNQVRELIRQLPDKDILNCLRMLELDNAQKSELIDSYKKSCTSKEDINEFVVSQYENISEPADYKPTDIILCSKTKCNGKICKKGPSADCDCSKTNYCLQWTKRFGNNKWKCLENVRDYSNGDVIIAAEKPKGKWEARHGFTIHSVQGSTYEETIYIDSRRLFDSRMSYTAISRARRWEQVKIIV